MPQANPAVNVAPLSLSISPENEYSGRLRYSRC